VLTASKDKLGNVWMGRISQGISVYITGRDSVINFLKKENSKIKLTSCVENSSCDRSSMDIPEMIKQLQKNNIKSKSKKN